MSEKLRQAMEEQELEQMIDASGVLDAPKENQGKTSKKKRGLLGRKSKESVDKKSKKHSKSKETSQKTEKSETEPRQHEDHKVKADFYEEILGNYLEATNEDSVQKLVSRTMEILNQEVQNTLEQMPEARAVELEDIFDGGASEYEEYGEEYYEEEENGAYVENIAAETDGQDFEDEGDGEDDWDLYSDNREELYENEHKFQLYELPESILRRYPFIRELPERIAIMGGMARSIARELVTGESKQREPVRDIDLVNIIDNDGSCYVSPAVRDQLSAEYMPDVFEQGQRMSNDTLEHYFDSRDFTINQVLIMNGQLILSNAAKNDFQENIVRPSHFEKPRESSWLKSGIAVKALFMKAAAEDFTTSVPTLEDLTFGQVFPVDVALNMDRAMERGIETAHAFTQELAEWGIIPTSYAGQPMAAAKVINQQVQNEYAEEVSEVA